LNPHYYFLLSEALVVRATLPATLTPHHGDWSKLPADISVGDSSGPVEFVAA
jgi:hypothetical protein